MSKGVTMVVLSLFDGISCGQVALQRAGINVDKYYASEIDPNAIKVTQHNFPDTIQVGDVTKLKGSDLLKIDLLIGGSPCQSISGLGDKSGLDGKSGLFYEYLRLKNEVNPRWFLLENVRGNKKAVAEITRLMGVEPVLINSALVSAQNRNRLYWTNIQFDLPEDKDIRLKDILEEGIPEQSILTPGRMRWITSEKGKKSIEKGYCNIDPEKAGCLTVRAEQSWNSNYVHRDGVLTRLTTREYERLQTLPDGYTDMISATQAYRAIGNAWTVDVIAHIFKGLKQ
jgi:site-specific DNA-cytosine methylase